TDSNYLRYPHVILHSRVLENGSTRRIAKGPLFFDIGNTILWLGTVLRPSSAWAWMFPGLSAPEIGTRRSTLSIIRSPDWEDQHQTQNHPLRSLRNSQASSNTEQLI